MSDIPFRFYHSIDVLSENLHKPRVVEQQRLEITSSGLSHLIGFEFLNFAIPLMMSKQLLECFANFFLGLLQQDFSSKKMIQGVMMHFFSSLGLLMVANLMYTQADVLRYRQQWLIIFAHVVAWRLSFHLVYYYLFDEHQILSLFATSIFGIGMVQSSYQNLTHRIFLFLLQLQQERITLVLPYHLLKKPYLNSIPMQLIDWMILKQVLILKPEGLQIEWDASGQLPNIRPENLIYYGLIQDFKYLKPKLHFNLKRNHLFRYLSRTEIDHFIVLIPQQKRDFIDLSENGESDYQRAAHPMRQLVLQYNLNEDVGQEILSYLPKY
jgi:hypothetical protein